MRTYNWKSAVLQHPEMIQEMEAYFVGQRFPKLTFLRQRP